MSYAQIHTQAIRHRKVLSLSAPAFRVWVAGHCYCQEHLSDGQIPKVALVALGVPVKPAWVAELLAQALWHDTGDVYTVHDWTDWNATRAQVETRRKTAKERREKWLSKRAADAQQDAPANGVANGVANAYPNGVANAVDNGSDTQRNANATLTHRTAVLVSRQKRERQPLSADADAPPSVDAFVEAWHDTTTPPIGRCRDLTPKRRAAIKARLKDRPLEAWVEVFQRIEASPFCRGDNDRGWHATIDWVLQPETALKVLEGKYDRTGSRASPPPGPPVVVSTETWAEARQRQLAEAKAARGA